MFDQALLIKPGCISAGRRALPLVRRHPACASRSVLAPWHAADSHWRLLIAWLSPASMWSHWLPYPLQSGSCCWAWHRLLALRLTAARKVGQFFGKRCRLSEVDQRDGVLMLVVVLLACTRRMCLVCLAHRRRHTLSTARSWPCLVRVRERPPITEVMAAVMWAYVCPPRAAYTTRRRCRNHPALRASRCAIPSRATSSRSPTR